MPSEILKSSYSSNLMIGDVSLPCSVLEPINRPAIRVVTLRGLNTAFTGTFGGGVGVRKMPRFLNAKELKPFISAELMACVLNPIEFIPKHHGRSAYGYNAILVPEICELLIDAKMAGAIIAPEQVFIAETLIRVFARIGIIALIDEATGYQEVRGKKALFEFYDRFFAPRIAAWTKTFPNDYYREIYRLRGWPYDPNNVKRPSIIAKDTIDIVYNRLAPGILEELQRLNPKNEKWRRKYKHFQWLTDNVGHPALDRHLHALLALMKASTNWKGFSRLVQRSFPKQGEVIQLLLLDMDE